MTVDPVPGVVSLGYRYVDFKTDTLNWIIKATIGKLRMRNGMQPQNVLAEPQQLENSKYRKRYVSFSVLNRL